MKKVMGTHGNEKSVDVDTSGKPAARRKDGVRTRSSKINKSESSEIESKSKAALNSKTLKEALSQRKKKSSYSLIEFGGSIGVIGQLVFATLLVTVINVACTKSQCSYTSLPNLEQFKDLRIWFSWRSLVIYTIHWMLQALLFFLPCCGNKVTLPDSGTVFTTNGVLILCIYLVGVAILEYFNIPIFLYIYEEYYSLYIVGIVTAILLSLCVYIKSRNAPDEKRNPYGNSGSFIYDLGMGREVNTFFFRKMNLKIVALRCSLCACVIYNLAYVYLDTSVKNFPVLSLETIFKMETYTQIAESISINPTLISFVFLQFIYLVYNFIQENHFHTTFEYHSEGTGLILLLGYSFYPYSTMSITKYIFEHNVRLSPVMLAIGVSIGLIGAYINYASNNVKNMFRTNPKDPKLGHLDSISTPDGKRLMTSGWWGIIRHPNYLGDMIIHISWAMPAFNKPPAIYNMVILLYLLLRTKRDERRCLERHGTAWEKYCKKVPYAVIPKVF